jgi:hypothetical protein
MKGVETNVVWAYDTVIDDDNGIHEDWVLGLRNSYTEDTQTVPAYDAIDLWNVLPDSIKMQDCPHGEVTGCVWYSRCYFYCDLRIEKVEQEQDNCIAGYICRDKVYINYEENYDSKDPIQALSDLLIWCKEHGCLDKSSGTEEEI